MIQKTEEQWYDANFERKKVYEGNKTYSFYIWPNGSYEFYLNSKIHREHGPALYRPDVGVFWMQKNMNHRIGGPAVIESDGTKSWWIMGVEYTEAEYNKQPLIMAFDVTKKWNEEEILLAYSVSTDLGRKLEMDNLNYFQDNHEWYDKDETTLFKFNEDGSCKITTNKSNKSNNAYYNYNSDWDKWEDEDLRYIQDYKNKSWEQPSPKLFNTELVAKLEETIISNMEITLQHVKSYINSERDEDALLNLYNYAFDLPNIRSEDVDAIPKDSKSMYDIVEDTLNGINDIVTEYSDVDMINGDMIIFLEGAMLRLEKEYLSYNKIEEN